LAPNDALHDPNFCNLKAHSLKRASKSFHTTHDARKSRFAPNTPDPLCAKGTRHLMHFARNGNIQRSLTLDIGYPSSVGSSFVIEIQAQATVEE